MKQALILFLLCFTLGAMPLFGVAHAATPTPTVAPGGLFKKETPRNPIQFPNLIKRFQNGDFLENFFSFAIDFIATLAALLAFGYILYGGFRYIVSAGNPSVADEGKKMVIGAVVGILIVALAYVLVLFVRNSLVGTLTQHTPAVLAYLLK